MSRRPENEVQNDNYLSVTAAEKPSSHRLSTSSIGSSATEVEDNSNLVAFNDRTTKRHTKIRLSRLDCLMGVFFPGKAKRKVEKTMETESADENQYINNHRSPWIITVNVLSKEKAGSHFIPKTAQCTVDTGNLQGNTVSREFLLDVLRYPETAIEPLKDSEKYGGVSTTGNILMPEGACHLTWYHGKSTQMFRGMRFLISPNPRCDLVIGAHSIEKHNLLSPPNLMADRTTIGDPKDPKFVKLNSIQERENTDCVNFESAIRRAKKDDPDEVKDLEKQLAAKKKLHKVSEADIRVYLARLDFARTKKPADEEWVKDKEAELEQAVKALPKGKETDAFLKELKDATITPVTTGFSANTNGSTSHRQGKKA